MYLYKRSEHLLMFSSCTFTQCSQFSKVDVDSHLQLVYSFPFNFVFSTNCGLSRSPNSKCLSSKPESETHVKQHVLIWRAVLSGPASLDAMVSTKL